MSNQLYDFHWPVDTGGYVWQCVRTAKDPLWLLTQGLGPPGPNRRTYQPLRDCSGLFRTFALTRPNRESILEFVNRFGRLGCEAMFDSSELEDPPRKGHFPDFIGEPFSVWVEEIRALRRLVRLWDMVQASDQSGLAARIQWSGDFEEVEVRYHSGPGRESEPELDPDCPAVSDLIASASYHPERFYRFSLRDRVGPSLAYLEEEVNKRVGHIPIRLVWDANTGRLQRALVPTNLRSALWLQFAEAIDGDRQYRACKVCGLWFELNPETARTNRLFCSTACKNRSYRGRQAQARQMHSDGKSLREIALELGTDVKTVKTWVTNTKE